MKVLRDQSGRSDNDHVHFDWLIGVWQNSKTSQSYEHWEKASEDLLIGTGYKTTNGEKIIQEKIRIEKINNNFFYIAEIPDSSTTVTFEITHVGEYGFVCESDEINFPQKIIYELNGYDLLTTQLEGMGKSLVFEFSKIE